MCPVCGEWMDAIEDPGNPGWYAPGYEPFCPQCGYREDEPITYRFITLEPPTYMEESKP